MTEPTVNHEPPDGASMPVAELPVRRRDVRAHELDGEALIYDPLSADTHHLNQTALFIWQQCDGRHDGFGIADQLASVYDVPRSEAVDHVESALERLHACKLITAASDA